MECRAAIRLYCARHQPVRAWPGGFYRTLPLRPRRGLTDSMNDRFKVPSLLSRRLGEYQVSLPAVLRRAGLPAGFFQQEKIYVTTPELFALWRAIGETSEDPAIGLKLGAEPRFER